MNWFDFLLIGIAAFYFIGGLIQGALKQIFNLFGFIIALALAFRQPLPERLLHRFSET